MVIIFVWNCHYVRTQAYRICVSIMQRELVLWRFYKCLLIVINHSFYRRINIFWPTLSINGTITSRIREITIILYLVGDLVYMLIRTDLSQSSTCQIGSCICVTLFQISYATLWRTSCHIYLGGIRWCSCVFHFISTLQSLIS